ncbi:MAG: substrate-binding domain-containing protein [Bacteroidetes bacterium]|jgi:phosphate transport system substrate-binding protein|nr:substrate-binding domain-containing protein [Bacteroidota bacterium]MBK7568164.1 substrate-binding domain-containing protein [Bacteroidota bacterium]MBP9795610.1 substrate-binding domain-containing protein [Chitinophagales bacterium]
MNIKNIYKIFFLLVIGICFWRCSSNSFDKDVENMNKGEIVIYADASYTSLVGELIKSYENVYPEAKIKATYASDREILDAFLQNKTQMIITGRELNATELAALEKTHKFEPEQFKIATEAIAVITSQNNPDSVFDMNEFIKSRKPGYTGKYQNTNFVFNKANGSMINQLIENEGASLLNMFSLDDKDTLASYIAANLNTIGFISFAEISDMDDPTAQAILEGVKVLSVSKTNAEGIKQVYELSQSTIATNSYPLQRSVTVVKGNISQLLGTGFVNFVYRSKASRIILKAGLIPAKMPEREIKVVE